MGTDERLNTRNVLDYSSLDVVFKAEGMGMATSGKEAICELEQAYGALRSHWLKKKVALSHGKGLSRLACE